MEDFFYSLVSERGDVVAFFVSALVILGGLVLRNFGSPFQKPASSFVHSDIKVLTDKVGAIDSRLRQVENDVEHLPTRAELHRLHLQITQLDGKMNSLEKTGYASAASLARLEDHLYNLARANK